MLLPSQETRSTRDPLNIIAIDGHSLLYRACFALPDTIRDPCGRPVNGIHGFITMLAKLLREHRPEGLLIAFDSPWPTLRHKLFPDYKAKRDALPATFLAQVPVLQALLQRIGFASLAIPGYEGDDILASLSERCSARNISLLLVSGDRDLFQLVRDPWVRLLFTKRGVSNAQILNERDIVGLVGVSPSRYGDFAAMRGDPADNISGAPGIGEKGALEIIRCAPTLEDLYVHPEQLPTALAAKLLAARPVIDKNLNLMRPIPTIPTNWDSIRLVVNVDHDQAKRAFAELGLLRACESLLTSLPASAPKTPFDTSVSSGASGPRLRHPKRISLVSCSAEKVARRAPAKDLYASALFRKSRRWAELVGRDWYILSAKHGLVSPDRRIAPYDESLKHAPKTRRAEWGCSVIDRIHALARPSDFIFLLAGGTYSGAILKSLADSGYHVVQPLEGMSIGRRLRWLTSACTIGKATADLEQFYEILSRLASSTRGPHPLMSADQRVWPDRGVYFFFEEGEGRFCSSRPRVVRVGTHAVSVNSKSTLWNRLRTHRGAGDGGGNHRSSIFRSHLGAAMIERDKRYKDFPYWGDQDAGTANVRSAESELEQAVSVVLSHMRILCVNIPDEPGPHSDRAYIERNSIALLAKVGSQLDTPSRTWLGHLSPHPSIRKSGLWNVNFVDDPSWDPAFLDVLDYYVSATIGKVPFTGRSIAPQGWWERTHPCDQLDFSWSNNDDSRHD